MKGALKILTLVVASALITACGAPQPGIMVNIVQECDESNCELLIDINNPGRDSYTVEYEFTAYASSSTIVGELEESFEVPGNYVSTLTRQVPVTAEPRGFSTGSTITRL